MTSTNDVTPVEDYSQPESEASSYSLDYWREMTERQVERLRARVKQLEDEAAPLRMQISALTNALHAVGQPGVTRPRIRHGPGAVSTRVSSAEREAITLMVQEGKSNREIREAYPHVPKSSIFNFAWNDRKMLGLPMLRGPRS